MRACVAGSSGDEVLPNRRRKKDALGRLFSDLVEPGAFEPNG